VDLPGTTLFHLTPELPSYFDTDVETSLSREEPPESELRESAPPIIVVSARSFLSLPSSRFS
jgi:hypothetical protein